MNLRQLVERGDRPFATQPQVARYFPAASVEDARQRLARSIERGDGPGVVIGAAGIGKSLLLQVLAAQYREKFDVVLLACAQLCTRRALLQAIHFELGLDYRRRDEGELRLSLLDTLLSGDESTQGLLLLGRRGAGARRPFVGRVAAAHESVARRRAAGATGDGGPAGARGKIRQPRTAIVQPAARRALLRRAADPRGNDTIYSRPTRRVARRRRSTLRRCRATTRFSPRATACRGW